MNNIYIAYLHSCGLTQSELTSIFSVENSAEDFYNSINNEKLAKYVKNSDRRFKILENYKKIETRKIDKILEDLKVVIICLTDKQYPKSLHNIPHTPFVIYVRGNIPKQDMFGVVGSRKITEYGKKVISKIVPDISKVFPIVSGGAAGCDSEAHRVTLKSGNKTVVVIGTGIDQNYPISNKKLFDTIVSEGGAIISIFRVGEPGNPYNFPVRNEIVVGLSKGILVVEAKEKSGSLITANLALDLGKDLFSVPGEITSPSSSGTNMLIKKGEAKCISDSTDILEEYDILLKQSAHKKQIPLLDSAESKIYKHISLNDCSIDDLEKLEDMSPSVLGVKLSLLELKGIVKKGINGKYTLA